MAEMPEGGAELERVARRSPGRGPSVSGQVGDGLVELPGTQRRPELDDGLDLGGSGVPSEWRTPGGTTIVSPARAMSCWPLRVKRAWPEVIDEAFFLVRGGCAR